MYFPKLGTYFSISVSEFRTCVPLFFHSFHENARVYQTSSGFMLVGQSVFVQHAEQIMISHTITKVFHSVRLLSMAKFSQLTVSFQTLDNFRLDKSRIVTATLCNGCIVRFFEMWAKSSSPHVVILSAI